MLLKYIISFICLLCCFGAIPPSQSASSSRFKFDPAGGKKYLQATEELVKKLEYAATENELHGNHLSFGLAPIDLNLLSEEQLAREVEGALQEEFSADDAASGIYDEPVSISLLPGQSDLGYESLMYKGTFVPSNSFNIFIDRILNDVQKEVLKRKLDPVFFEVHRRGILRFASNKKKNKKKNNKSSSSLSEAQKAAAAAESAVTRISEADAEAVRAAERQAESFIASQSEAQKASEVTAVSEAAAAEAERSAPKGAGAVRGLRQVKRFSVETEDTNNATLVRSHQFFGPIDIEMFFNSRRRGIQRINSTVVSLPSHALFEVLPDGKAKVLEFIIDSPLDYEIKLQGSKNRRFNRLSEAAILRMFKRNGRMERRLQNCFIRAVKKGAPKENKAKDL